MSFWNIERMGGKKIVVIEPFNRDVVIVATILYLVGLVPWLSVRTLR